MAAQLIRIGAVARIDPDPEVELDSWRRDLLRGAIDDPAATQDRLDAHERGEVLIVRLHLFAEFLDGGSLVRRNGAIVPGCWFARGATRENADHARELVIEHTDDLADELMTAGVQVRPEELALLPVLIEIDDDVAKAVRSSTG